VNRSQMLLCTNVWGNLQTSPQLRAVSG